VFVCLKQKEKRKIKGIELDKYVYSQSTINAYSLLSHEWWVPLIKFMV